MRAFSIQQKLMGSAFELLLVHDNEKTANTLLKTGIEEIKRIENLLSEFLPDSETTRINQNAFAQHLPIDSECYRLIERSLAISKLTKGCFDITTSPLKRLYSFKNKDFELPSAEEIEKTLEQVGYKNIELKDGRIHFSKPLTISFAAIGKGYASDRVKKLWLEAGVTSGYINASGDLNAFGSKADGSSWKIGVANPDDQSNMLLYIPVDNASVATSGDYEQYFMNKGIRYSHNINPQTGLPLTGIKSVSVFSPSAELSDALATAVYVMGSKKGIAFVDQLPKTHAIIIDNSNHLFFSKNLQYEKAMA